MARPAPTYDLVLLLDSKLDDAERSKLVADATTMIQADGELARHDHWGSRALAYPIDDATDADYHLLQFHVSSTELLSELDRTLRITDGVLRFRIIKLRSGTPEAPDMQTPSPIPARAPVPEPLQALETADPSAVGEPA
jgi:small subunit ribosomal protein S6